MSQFSPEPEPNHGDLARDDLLETPRPTGDPSETPIGDQPVTEERRDPPSPEPPQDEPPPPRHPEDPPPSQEPPVGDPMPSQTPIGDPPRGDTIQT